MNFNLEFWRKNSILTDKCKQTLILRNFQVYPDYLPVGEDDAIELVFGKGQKTKTPLSVTMHRIILDKSKKQSKIVVQKTDFIIGNVQLHNSALDGVSIIAVS